ncbi:MAG: hypothetical protein JKY53_00145 [Flavobacteriales bacterium]|nr:hypothetical protein [Flavobacteriales bacterium]
MPFKSFKPVEDFQRARTNALGIRSKEQAIDRESRAAPVRNELATLELGEARRGAAASGQKEAIGKFRIMNQTANALLKLPESEWPRAAALLNPGLKEFGIPQLIPAEMTRENLQAVSTTTEGFITDPAKLTAAEQKFAVETKGLTPEQIKQKRLIDAGIKPRAVGSAVQTITDKGTAADVAITEATIAGAKEEAKLIKQLKLKPEIESAVVTAVAGAKAEIDAIADQKSNSTTLKVYDTAMSGLVTALGGTVTGPVAGWLPALTTNSQIAEGAVAAMSPVLKQLFRGAGEGTFTDQDQKLLNEMIPTRKDTKAARIAKIQNIDAIVRAKLGIDQGSGGGQARQGGQLMIDAQGNRAMVFPDGTFEEVQ